MSKPRGRNRTKELVVCLCCCFLRESKVVLFLHFILLFVVDRPWTQTSVRAFEKDLYPRRPTWSNAKAVRGEIKLVPEGGLKHPGSRHSEVSACQGAMAGRGQVGSLYASQYGLGIIFRRRLHLIMRSRGFTPHWRPPGGFRTALQARPHTTRSSCSKGIIALSLLWYCGILYVYKVFCFG